MLFLEVRGIKSKDTLRKCISEGLLASACSIENNRDLVQNLALKPVK